MAGKADSDDAFDLERATPAETHDAGFINPEQALIDVCLRQAIPKEVYTQLERGLPALVAMIVPGQDWLVPLATGCTRAFRRKTMQKIIGGKPSIGARPIDADNTIAEAVRSYAAGRSVILVVDTEERIAKRLRSIATVITISPPSPPSFRRLARLSLSGRLPPNTAMDLTPLSFTELLGAMSIGSPVATVISRLKTLLDCEASDDIATDPLKLEEHAESEAKSWGIQLVQDIADYKAGRLEWHAIDHGCVLSGVPGTGKTQLVRSIAAAALVPLIRCSIIELFGGDGHLNTTIKNIRQAFGDATRVRPSILFFDELDSLPARDAQQSSRNRDYWSALHAALLLMLDDGTSSRDGVVVIGATNRPHVLDPALLRPGRFERIIEVPPPDEQGRERALRYHLKNDLLEADLGRIAKLTGGMTPADLMALVRTAQRRVRQLKRPIEIADLVNALDLGAMSEKHRKRVALHESGHGLVAHVLPELRLQEISLVANPGQLGSARFETTDSGLSGLEALVTALLAGMAAELEVLGNMGVGSGGEEFSDLAKATAVLTSIHANLGLSENLVWLGFGKRALELLNTDNELRATVQSDLRRLLARAREIVRNNIYLVHRLSESLIENLVLNGDDVAKIASYPICDERPAI